MITQKLTSMEALSSVQ